MSEDKNDIPSPKLATEDSCPKLITDTFVDVALEKTENLKCKQCSCLNTEVSRLLKSLETLNNNEPITEFNLLTTCINMMRIVEQIENMSGVQKKNIVVETMNLYMKNTNSDMSIFCVVPNFIDSAISLERGTLTIGNILDIGTTCCFGLVKNSQKRKK